MSKQYQSGWVIVIAVCVSGAAVWACEDEHPPVVSKPVEELTLRGRDGSRALALTLDPRGVGSVAPPDDDADEWLDTSDEDGAWHYREWQWWKGHPWGDSCRPRYYSELDFRPLRGAARGAAISYRIDGFDCRQTFLAPEVAEADAPHWDVVLTIRNSSGRDVEEYGHFFACYTPLNRDRSFWYWDQSGELVRFADRGVGHLDGYVAHPKAYFLESGAIPHCPRGGGKIVGRWRQPVMVSQASPAGWRSVIMVERERAAALAQGIYGKAMDYILFPGPDQRRFADGTEFSAHVRHVMLKSPELPTTERLQKLWQAFDRSHAETRKRAVEH